MHILYSQNWKKVLDIESLEIMRGLRVRVDRGVDDKVRSFCLDFAKWLRKEFGFPLRVNIYIKESYRIRAKDGDLVVGTIWRPDDMSNFPYIRIATGDYTELVEERGVEQAMWAILWTFAHEIVHYFQHINGLQLTLRGEEIQASRGAQYILDAYNKYLTQL